MPDRNPRNRHERRARYDRSPDYDGQQGYRQQEQFSTANERDYGDYGQMGETAYGRADYRQSDPDYATTWDRQERNPQEERGYSRRERGPRSTGHYNYGPAQVEGPGRGFASFTSEDQAGRDFTAPTSRPDYRWQGGGMAAGPTGYGYPGGTTRGDYYGSEHERGFLDRAGDEIASWFGDEEAARRREMDHSGRGPQNYTRSDERILEDACDNLTDDWAVDARNVQVTVENGEVTLDGTVPDRRQKRRAEDCVECISGVGHVQNNLRVEERQDRDGKEPTTAEQPAATT